MLVNSQEKIVKIPEVIAYARVSSREQTENSAALVQQISFLKAAGAVNEKQPRSRRDCY